MVLCNSDTLTMEELDINQNLTHTKKVHLKNFSNILPENEALRRATLLKHRKVSTQLKLDMVQRQLSSLRRTVTDTDNDRQFYRSQMAELSNELQDLDSTLDKVERNAFYTRRKILRQCDLNLVSSSSTGSIHLSSSYPSGMFSSSENLSSRHSLKERVCHLVSSPTSKFRKRHFFGELRAAASLSSLNIKSSSPTSNDGDSSPTKDSKSWKTPLRFLGNLVDSRIRRRFWTSTKRTHSADNVLQDDKHPEICNDFERSSSRDEDGSSINGSSPESSDEDDEVVEWKLPAAPPSGLVKGVSRCVWKAPVARKISNSQKAQVDPILMAEIEDFEKMAAQYIKQHT